MQFDKIIFDGFAAALEAGAPGQITRDAYLKLEEKPSHVIALGKAAGAMATAVRDGGYDGPGLVITTDENHRQIDGFDCIASAHPVPDNQEHAPNRDYFQRPAIPNRHEFGLKAKPQAQERQLIDRP